MTHVDRRTLLLGSAAGLLLAGCGGGGKPQGTGATTTGPVIVKPRTGTVVTAADTMALRDELNRALASGDVKEMSRLINAADYAIEDFEKRWKLRLANFERVGFVEGQWYVGAPDGRTRNAAGGKVEYSGDLVFAHTVKGCDGQQVVESSRADFRKRSEDAPLELMHVGEVEASYDPSFWDVAEIDAIETPHAWVVYRLQDVKRADTSSIMESMERDRGASSVTQALDLLDGGKTIHVTLSNDTSVELMTLDSSSGKITGRWNVPSGSRNGLQASPEATPFSGGVALSHDDYSWDYAFNQSGRAVPKHQRYDVGLFRLTKPKKK